MTRFRLPLAARLDMVTRCVLLLALLGALPLVLLIPPLQVPDEPQHFERAYQISQLHLLAEGRDGKAGGMLPASLSDMVRDELGTTDLEADRPVTARPLARTLAGLSRPLAPERQAFTVFTGAAPYSPLPYAPQAVAIAAGRAAGLGPLGLLYAARLANALSAILLLVLAVRVAPFAREALAFAGLLPMALYQYASASPDAVTIGATLLFTALALRALVAGWTGRSLVAATLLGAVFCSHKPVYAPLLLIALVPPLLRAGQRRPALVANGLILLVALGTAIGWLALNRSLSLTRLPGTDVARQVAFVTGDPLGFAAILRANLMGQAFRYWVEMIGVIGWLAVPLPAITYTLALFVMVLAVLIRRPEEPALPRIAGVWQLLLVTGCILLVELALYLTWNPVGWPEIVGVQGRYFLPLAAPFLAGVGTLLRLPADAARSRIFAAMVLALAAAQIVVLDTTLVAAYALF